MDLIWQYTLVFLAAATPWIEIAAVIPLAILAGLKAVPVGVLSFIGNWLTVFLLIYLYKQWQQWRQKRRMLSSLDEEGEEKGEKEDKSSKRKEKAKRIWNRYGLPGLALLGPFLTGSHLAALMALAFGSPKNLVAIWMTISLALWAIALTVAAYYGIDFLSGLRSG